MVEITPTRVTAAPKPRPVPTIIGAIASSPARAKMAPPIIPQNITGRQTREIREGAQKTFEEYLTEWSNALEEFPTGTLLSPGE
jgi:hypothetical protein